jgi:hypothetical protein
MRKRVQGTAGLIPPAPAIRTEGRWRLFLSPHNLSEPHDATLDEGLQ